MIPQAIATTGDYADLWTNLKSMEHALARVETAAGAKDLYPLDRSRIDDLSDFLSRQLQPPTTSDEHPADAFFPSRPSHTGYTLNVDLVKSLEEMETFKSWPRKSLTRKDKIERLIAAPREYLAKIELMPTAPPPKTEFAILRDLLRKLLTETESALMM
ncbi:hypothetical protein [Prosthecobacter sp.]|uniref:hypothetical protein n=1 Tax=Prosthecobacter sp. TaxID=1965333 RepID=UPI002AB82118|nr:hypothetical protein [Prosthecobacter sp.]MDZ4404190.1 hypothetical protein [Prosthecobacter sp.]